MVTVVYFLHVLLAFTAIAFLVVPGLILEMAARTKDVPFIRRLFRLASFHGRVGGMIALLTAIVGFIVAWRVGIPLNAGWMIAAYVVFVVVAVVPRHGLPRSPRDAHRGASGSIARRCALSRTRRGNR